MRQFVQDVQLDLEANSTATIVAKFSVIIAKQRER
jgi:hypothetical protein